MRQYVGFGSKQSKYHKNYHMIYKFLEDYKYFISEVLKTVKLNEISLLYHMVLGGHSVHKYNFTSLDI